MVLDFRLLGGEQFDTFSLMEDRKVRRVYFITTIDISNDYEIVQTHRYEFLLVGASVSSQYVFFIQVVAI